MADRPPRDTEDSSPDDSSSNQGCCGKIPNCIGCLGCFRNRPARTESQSSSTSSEIPQVQERGVRSDIEGSSRPLQQEESTVDSQRGVNGTSSQLTGAPSSPLSQLVIHKSIRSRIPSDLESSSSFSPQEESSASVWEIGDTSSPATKERLIKEYYGFDPDSPIFAPSAKVTEAGPSRETGPYGSILPPSPLEPPAESSVEPGPYSPHDGEPSKPILKRPRTDAETEPAPEGGKKSTKVTFPGLGPRTPSSEQPSVPTAASSVVVETEPAPVEESRQIISISSEFPPCTPSSEQPSVPTSPSSVVVETEPAPVEERRPNVFVFPAPQPPPASENPLPPAPPSTPDDAPDDVSTP